MEDDTDHRHQDPDNTRTPLVVWGSGIRGPQRLVFGRSAAWNLTVQGERIWQADIATLMSTLLGKPLPANSVGMLPYRLLSADMERKARAMIINAKVNDLQFAT